jgi:hypothetical protein
MPSNLSNYAIAFLLTLLLELAVAVILGYRKRRELACVVLVNVITHPLLHCIVWVVRSFRYLPARDPIAVVLEVGVVVVEWQLLCYALPNYRKRNLLVLSATMNAVSYGAGLILPIWVM